MGDHCRRQVPIVAVESDQMRFLIDAIDVWCIMPTLHGWSRVLVGVGPSQLGGLALKDGKQIITDSGDCKLPHVTHANFPESTSYSYLFSSQSALCLALRRI